MHRSNATAEAHIDKTRYREAVGSLIYMYTDIATLDMVAFILRPSGFVALEVLQFGNTQPGRS